VNLRGEMSEKQKIIQDIETASQMANSLDGLFMLIRKNGYELYSRDGRIVGIKGKRKYRFSSLGLHHLIRNNIDVAKKEQNNIPKKEAIQNSKDNRNCR